MTMTQFIKIIITEKVFLLNPFLFPLQGCNLSCTVELFAILHDLASVCVRTLLKLISSEYTQA